MKKNILSLLFIVLFSPVVNSSVVVMLTGDSFSNDEWDWIRYIEKGEINTTAIAGQRLTQMPTNFHSDLISHKSKYNINTAMIQGGINDIKSSNNLLQTLDDMTRAMTSMIDNALSEELDVYVFNIAPWNGSPSIVKSQAILDYNGWLNTYASAFGVTLIDMYSLVVDPNDPYAMLPEYDLDGLHLNTLGKITVASLVDSKMTTVPLPSSFIFLFTGLIGILSSPLIKWYCGMMDNEKTIGVRV